MQPPSQGARAESEVAVLAQIAGEQGHGSARRPKATGTGIPLKGGGQPPGRERSGEARPPVARPIGERLEIAVAEVACLPALYSGALYSYAPCGFTDRVPFGQKQQRLKPAVEANLAGNGQGTLETPPIGTGKR
jgi:hypothetical protein